MMDIEHVRSRFIKHFDGKTGNIYASPGRINLIGEHTDYNGGFVFPGAVDKGIMAEVRPNGTDTVMCYSIDLKDRVEFKVDDPKGPRASWAKYIYGIICVVDVFLYSKRRKCYEKDDNKSMCYFNRHFVYVVVL